VPVGNEPAGASANAGTVATSTSTNADVTTLIESVIFLVKKAAQTAITYLKWSNMKTALEDTRTALGLAEEAAKELTDAIPRTAKLMAKSGFYTFMNKISDAAVISDFESQVQAEKMMEGLEHCEGLATRIYTILTSIDGVVTVLDGVKELFDATNELADQVLDFNIAELVDPVKKKVKKGGKIIKKIGETIEDSAKRVMPLMEALAEEAAEVASKKAMKIYHKLIARYPKLFQELTEMLPQLEMIYDATIKPLLPELAKVVKMVEEQAEKIWPEVDRPDNVANETVGRYSHCAWRNTRRYISLKDVDVGNTMACTVDKSWYGRYVCWCAGTFDCYVEKNNRPEPAQLKRCFRPDDVTLEATLAPTTSPKANCEVGDEVEAFLSSGQWFPANITSINEDGTITLAWTVHATQPADHVRKNGLLCDTASADDDEEAIQSED
jgi:hypothetical protein